jgi:hypothetical protein
MKNIYLFSCLLILFMSQSLIAQETKYVPETEYIGLFAALDSSSGKLIDLERQTPEDKIKIKAMGFGGGEGFIQMKGETSPIRFKALQKIEFVVRVSSQQIDPISIIQFFRMESKKGVRRLSISKVGVMAVGSKSTANQNAISFNAAKYGESSFRIVPASLLLPGEYCLSGPGNKDGFCFGIDTNVEPEHK